MLTSNNFDDLLFYNKHIQQVDQSTRRGKYFMYVPIIKFQQYEKRAISKALQNNLLTEDMIPLFEIVKEEVHMDPLIDIDTVEVVTALKPGNRRKTVIKDPESKKVITLEILSSLLAGKQAFVDYFRFDDNVYEETNSVLAIDLTRDFSLYEKKLLEIPEYGRNLIPTVSIKANIQCHDNESLKDMLFKLRAKCDLRPIAVRIHNITGYEEVLSESLLSTDYLLYDIEEGKVNSRIYDFRALMQSEIPAKKILLNSPRPRKLDNTGFEKNGYTIQIDNSVLTDYKFHGFDGFGDYCGLRDKLTKQASTKFGCAISLLFDYHKNQFRIYANPDGKLGQRGYSLIAQRVLNDEALIDPTRTCIGLDHALGPFKRDASSGGWERWTIACMLRYIQQIKENHEH